MAVRMNTGNPAISHLAERTGHKLVCLSFILLPLQFFASSRESVAPTEITVGLVLILGLLSPLVRNPRMFIIGGSALSLSFAGMH